MNHQDPRLAQVVIIDKTHNRCVMRTGQADAPMNQRVTAISTAVTEYQRHTADLRASTPHMTAGEIEARRVAQTSNLAKVLDAHATAVTTASAELRLRMLAVPVKPGREVDFYQATLDKELRDQFNALSPTARAIKVHQMQAEPLQHLPTVEALLRAPRELSGLSHEAVTTLRVVTWAALRPGEFAALDDEVQQLNTAIKAITIAGLVLSETGVAANTMLYDAPTAQALLQDPAAVAVRWLPAGADERYAPERAE